jgi:NDP-sugar pyrophosphorylase family protein
VAVCTPEAFFDLSSARWADIFEGVAVVWEALSRLPAFIAAHAAGPLVLGEGTRIPEGVILGGGPIVFGRGCTIEPGAYLRGPFLAGDEVTVRHGAYVRGNVLVGDRGLIGHATEVKSAILLDDCSVPHFNYVGDSILGRQVNLGAGAITANFRFSPGTVQVGSGGDAFDTGLAKLGAILGDGVRAGANVVLNPGTLVGPRTLIYPGCSVRGTIPADSVLKLRQQLEQVRQTT